MKHLAFLVLVCSIGCGPSKQKMIDHWSENQSSIADEQLSLIDQKKNVDHYFIDSAKAMEECRRIDARMTLLDHRVDSLQHLIDSASATR